VRNHEFMDVIVEYITLSLVHQREYYSFIMAVTSSVTQMAVDVVITGNVRRNY